MPSGVAARWAGLGLAALLWGGAAGADDVPTFKVVVNDGVISTQRIEVPAGQRFHEAGIAALRIAKTHVCMAAHSFHRQRGHTQRVFVAGHLDDLGEAVFLLDFRNGQAGNIGFEGKNFLPHADLKHAFSITGHGIDRQQAFGAEEHWG